jgi:hypothetical protein
LFPAIAGGSFYWPIVLSPLLISVSSAIEGLKPNNPDLPVIPIVLIGEHFFKKKELKTLPFYIVYNGTRRRKVDDFSY